MSSTSHVVFATLLVAMLSSCQSAEDCKGSGSGVGRRTWTQCGDSRDRQVECQVLPAPGQPAPVPGQPVECRCTLGGVVGKTFQMSGPAANLIDSQGATRTANEQCGWHLTVR